MEKYKICQSRTILTRLIKCGYMPVRTLDNPTKPGLQCWLFERSEEFDKLFDQFVDEAARKKKGGSDNGRE